MLTTEHFHFTKLAGPGLKSQRRADWNFSQIRSYWLCISSMSQGEGSGRLGKQHFRHMAAAVKTRNANQCRIFHLRMTKLVGTIPQIDSFFRNQHALAFATQFPTCRNTPHSTHSFTLRKDHMLWGQDSSANPPQLKEQVGVGESKEVGDLGQICGVKLYDEYNWIDEIEDFVTSLGIRNWLDEML